MWDEVETNLGLITWWRNEQKDTIMKKILRTCVLLMSVLTELLATPSSMTWRIFCVPTVSVKVSSLQLEQMSLSRLWFSLLCLGLMGTEQYFLFRYGEVSLCLFLSVSSSLASHLKAKKANITSFLSSCRYSIFFQLWCGVPIKSKIPNHTLFL